MHKTGKQAIHREHDKIGLESCKIKQLAFGQYGFLPSPQHKERALVGIILFSLPGSAWS